MPHYDVIYPGRFIKATELEQPTVIRIAALVSERLQGDDGEKAKGVLRFKDATGEREAVWCRTNAILTAAALGTDDIEQWKGRLITIANDPTVMFGREKVGGIRVFGSPELAKETRVQIKRPRRKHPETYVLRPTDTRGRVREPGKAEAAPHCAECGEVTNGGAHECAKAE